MDSFSNRETMTSFGEEPFLDSPTKSQLSLSKILFVGASLVAIVCVSFLIVHRANTTPDLLDPVSPDICAPTLDPVSCSATFAAYSAAGETTSSVELLKHILKELIQSQPKHLVATQGLAHQVPINGKRNQESQALADGLDLLDQTQARLLDSFTTVTEPSWARSRADVHAWLSGVLTNYVTCLDGLNGAAKRAIEVELKPSMGLVSTSLAVLNRRPAVEPGAIAGEWPSWLSKMDRKLLMDSNPDKAVAADAVVAKDGSGTYTAVMDAVNAAPSKSLTRYVIYIKAGRYEEQVSIPKAKKNILLVGDGMDKTTITGSLNVVDGSTTFNSATLASVGDGFMAQDLWIQNTAGPEKHQAVALRVGADQSIVHRCRLDGYQDTLYAHSLRQFYRDSIISGTIDYIFGNAAVVFQNCSMVSRRPLSNQQNIVTAQGRTDPNQNTATAIQSCKIFAAADLEPVKGSIPTYLGRPWKLYSRTIVMQSTLDDSIHQAGWLPWDGTFALDTLEYREYLNTGPGAGTSNRVTWAGYHATTTATEAATFTVGSLIQGAAWLAAAGVSFIEGL